MSKGGGGRRPPPPKRGRAPIKHSSSRQPCVSGRLHCSFLTRVRPTTTVSQQRRNRFDESKPARPPERAISIREREREPPTRAAAIDDDEQRESREEAGRRRRSEYLLLLL